MKFFKIFLLFSLLSVSANLFAFDFLSVFRHSEIAPKNSLFADVGLAPLAFKDFQFPILPLDVRVEYMLPVPLPFSFGIFLKTPNPDLDSFGVRIGYHFNLLDDQTDFYAVYSYDFGFLRNDILVEYDDTSVPIHWYDFRFGARHFFKRRYGVGIETGFKFQSLIFLVSIKVF